MMLYPAMKDLLAKVPSRYQLVNCLLYTSLLNDTEEAEKKGTQIPLISQLLDRGRKEGGQS